MGSLPRYVLQRILLVIPMMFILLTMVFILLRVAPGDPISAAVGDKLDPAALEAKKTAAGLNRPLIVQYLEYMGNTITGNFGQTITDNRPVLEIVRDNGGATLTLTLGAFLIALLVGIPLGRIAARRRDTAADGVIRIFGIVSYATPIFFIGLLMQLYVARPLGLPTSSMANAKTTALLQSDPITHVLPIDALITGQWAAFGDIAVHHILPCFTLGLMICGVFIRMTRVNLLQTLQSDYVEAARARGIHERRVISKHAFRNALVPVVTIIGLQIAMMMGGAVLTESTFNWPGLGTQLMKYIQARDYIGVQGIITFFALIVAAVSVVVDIVNALIDPRVRYE
ncbi:MAG: ABC transporter permease [Propionibacteriaceae bacterium]|jgi:peptide/nickel transport system permease protein|nr:ABC transporter permease [Propionibacteriaceae bacterium]